ncbi:MAG: 2-polyprenyl-3-methyl-6-methoxy-1,4-benzoquinone monooxygenase [Mariprofundales bacterium]
MQRNFSFADRILCELDHALNSVFCRQHSSRPYPAEDDSDTELSQQEKQTAASMMRVNHAGEICAQALYQGQSLTARQAELAIKLHQASIEEADHLNWCRQRLHELDAQPSKLDPLWYLGSFSLGILVGLAGDRWNLGFLAETEYQVTRHLDGHLSRLSKKDIRSRNIIEQMRQDELGHAFLAENLGATPLPPPVKIGMRFTAKIMTTLASKV